MTAPLLASKLRLPLARERGVARPGLIARLNEALGSGRRLTLISAPAGYGKTTLARDWVAQCARPAAWLSLEEADDEPGRFLTYLIAALQTLVAGIGAQVLTALQNAQTGSADRLLTPLLNELASLDDDLILVLDDFHTIRAAAVHSAVTYLVERLPAQVHLVIVTREDPPLPIARLRARGQLTELHAADLRFTEAEAAAFLQDVMGLALTAADVAALEARTEGWIAGLQLAALSLQGQADASEAVRAFTGAHAFVLDYLLEEVLRRLPEHVQVFLLDTAILDRLCGPLCDALRPERDTSGAETLAHLQRVNAFVVPLDNERRWYRYHHLFQDLLRQRLTRTLPPADIARLHRHAGAWFEAHDDIGEAIRHALAANDADRAAQMAEKAWEAMDRSFQSAAWLSWVQRLPERFIAVRPVLCTQIAWSFVDVGEVELSESHLRLAERCLSDPTMEPVVVETGQFATLPARIALVRAYSALTGGALAEAAHYAEQCLSLAPADDAYLRAPANSTLGCTCWARGDLPAAVVALTEWVEWNRHEGVAVFAVGGAFGLAEAHIELGHLGQGFETYRWASDLASALGAEAEGVSAHLALGLGLIHHERGEDERAAVFLQRAFALGPRSTLVDWGYRRSLAEARLRESEGDLAGALERLDDAARLYVRTAFPNARPVEAMRARLYLRLGDLRRARDWVRASGVTPDDAPSYLREFEHVTLARVLTAEYRVTAAPGLISAALGLLARLLPAAAAQDRIASQIDIHIARALALHAQGDHAPALAALRAALALAEPEGYRRIFSDEGEPLATLLAQVAAERLQPGDGDYATALVAASRSDPRPAGRTDLIEPLSERELDVLRLVAQGLSNQEISQRLFLALSTVKGHNLRVFGKLQARNRTDAVARARAVGLL
ncbi:MAG: AAA family ATPase [Anaerolineales bacterium]|nr:AAA family ATPase [Anaerolineales bacterium]